MKKSTLFALVSSVLLLAPLPELHAQLTTGPAGQSSASQPAAQATLADRRQALNDLFHDYWEDRLKHDPEFASEIGDLRYNDQISDYSVAAYNDRLAREQRFELRLAAIDPTGFTDQEQISQELLLRTFDQDQEAAEFKGWEMPVNQMGGIYSEYPQLVAELSFKTVKDYDDWIARLHAIPHAFDQVTTNMSIGMDDHRVPPKYLLEKTSCRCSNWPTRSLTIRRLRCRSRSSRRRFSFRAGAHQERNARCISKEVLPAYLRFARFLEVSYIPAARQARHRCPARRRRVL